MRGLTALLALATTTAALAAGTGRSCRPGNLETCPTGSLHAYAVPSILFDDASGASLVLAASTVGLGICGPAPVRYFCKSDDLRATYFQVKWANCGNVGRVTLRGHIPPDCVGLTAILGWHDPATGKRRVRKILAER